MDRLDRTVAHLFMVVGILSVGATAGLSAQTVASVGRIEAAAGTVLLRRTETIAPQPGSSIQPSDIIRIEKGGAARLVLTDGSTILIAEDSELRVVGHDPDTQRTLIEMLHGHVQASAAPITKQGGFFRIHTPTASVFALGTDLDVRTESSGAPAVGGSVRVVSNGMPVANADVVLVLANLGKVPVGKTDDRGRRKVAAADLANAAAIEAQKKEAVLGLANLGKVQFHVEVEECQDGARQVHLVGAGAQPPPPAKNCKNKSLPGTFAWGEEALQLVTMDLTSGAIQAMPMVEALAPGPGPADLRDIPANSRPGVAGAISLADYRGVSTTVVTCFNHFVAVTSLDPDIEDATYLLPGQSSLVHRADSPRSAVPYDDARVKQLAGRGLGKAGDLMPPVTGKEFDPAGRPCEPAWVVNGELATAREVKYEYKITGLGTSTGNALSVKVTNESPCALYFLVTDGTILHPKGFTERLIVGLLIGSTSLKDFQKMITMGGFLRVPPARMNAGNLVAGEVTSPLRSYCVEFHKLAPHQKTEYKIGDDDDQKDLGPNVMLINRTFKLVQTRQLLLTQNHGLDSVLQWSLWSKLEELNDKKFMEEFNKLVHKNYDSQKRKWDKAAEQQADASGRELWKLVQTVLN